MKKQYTITIELEAENDIEAFNKLEAAVNGSSNFSMLRHRVDSMYVDEYDEGEYFNEDQLGIFKKEKEDSN